MSIDGTRELEQKLRAMAELNPRQAVATAIQTVRSAAVLKCHVDMGELRQSISADVTQQEGKTVGTC